MSEEMKALRKQLLRDERSGYDVLDAAQRLSLIHI